MRKKNDINVDNLVLSVISDLKKNLEKRRDSGRVG